MLFVFSPDFDYIVLQHLSNHHKSGFKTTWFAPVIEGATSSLTDFRVHGIYFALVIEEEVVNLKIKLILQRRL